MVHGLRLSSKIITTIIITGLIAYLFNKNNEKLDLIENYFVSIMITIFIVAISYTIFETIYIYGINSVKSQIIILFIILGAFILINLNMYNNSFKIINK
tara:strand:- start:234 stop:530 length:297 start_codon:yes stop_codon:yes gene_type:complete